MGVEQSPKKHLTFQQHLSVTAEKGKVLKRDVEYTIWNDKQINLGCLQKIKVGRWMSWCLFLNEGCYLSASCQDEVREKTRELNNKQR